MGSGQSGTGGGRARDEEGAGGQGEGGGLSASREQTDRLYRVGKAQNYATYKHTLEQTTNAIGVENADASRDSNPSDEKISMDNVEGGGMGEGGGELYVGAEHGSRDLRRSAGRKYTERVSRSSLSETFARYHGSPLDAR